MKRLEIVAILVLVVVVTWAVGNSMITTRPTVLCTYSGSPYLDPGIPDECEQGEGPQPGPGECGIAGNTRCIDPDTGEYPSPGATPSN